MLAVGGIAGLGGGLVSLGVGTLVIPLLMGWLGLSPVAARGTAMAVALCTSSVASLTYWRHGMMDLRVVIWVALPALLITPLAAASSQRWSSAACWSCCVTC